MADPCRLVPLPQSVDQLIEKICIEQNQTPPGADVRRRLAAVGEESSLQLLNEIAPRRIRKNLSAFIYYLLKEQYNPNSYSSSPSSSPSKKDISPISHSPTEIPSYFSPRTPPPVEARLHRTPPDSISSTSETVPNSMVTELPRGRGRALLEALGELEFRKQFLILSYSGGKELQTVIAAEEIRTLRDLPMIKFEQRVWEDLGQRYVLRGDRRMHLDWDSGKTHIYHCHVSRDGNISFKGPYLSKTTTHLQKVLGDDNVLMVKFDGEIKETHPLDYYYDAYSKIAKEGILVGLRRYRFFVFKDGGKEKRKKNPTSSPVKCYFVRMETEAFIDKMGSYKLSNMTVAEARCYFMHAHMVSSVPTYMARLSLILSKTISLETELSSVNVQRIRDEYCKDEHKNLIFRDEKPLIHTDGTGFISEDLALLCPNNLQTGGCLGKEDAERILNVDEHKDKVLETKQPKFKTREPPLLIQFRLFNNGYAVKGTFLVNKKLPPRTMQIRDSMVKVERDERLSNNQTANSMEIVGTSNPPKKTYLSRNLIALLSHGGVPNEYFLNVLQNALQDTHAAFSNKRVALKVAIRYGDIDDNFTVARMILSGIPLEESWLQYRLSILMKEEKKSLKEGRLYVPECYYLMGTVDPTGKLESDEVCIVLDNGHVSGKVLVYRNPGSHFGDIHVLKAIFVEELESFVGNSKYAIFFSRKGPRSIAYEIARGDFDGDMYWISRNPQLLEYFKPSEPWIPSSSMPKVASKKPNLFSDEELDDEFFKLFLKTRFQPSFAISEAAYSWLALMDRFLTLGSDDVEEKNLVKKNILRLIDIYYDAVDAPKSGGEVEVPDELRVKMFPHFLKKTNSYRSTSILGLIYDVVDSYQAQDLSNEEISKLPCFDVEVPEACFTKWKEHYGRYRAEMSIALKNKDRDCKNEAADLVIKKYKKILYEAEEFEESKRNTEDINNEAVAIYHLVYDYAKSTACIPNCGFAWKVAGPALFKLCTMKQSERSFLCSPFVLRELF
ncbi:probable RNA-dependent RNA polymerase 3 [Ziziphus jujuba]|uniref:RNA-dependent RNA polymerase n=1 Tax=Ziziphus jujuba TaxID=326968 RepID=A0ABM3ZVI3_ZIZJJ|nr:probable RNA-dependent RNA polymerase 3 [Ziziphus jujuba]